jgi:DNA ligase-associated metallophosphoesterase
MTGATPLQLAGADLVALPQRALHWPAEGALIVADLHLGKAAAFRSLGVPVPETLTEECLGRLSEAIAATGARRIYLLGDLVHAKRGYAPGTCAAFRAWRAAHDALDLVLVRGNHDRRSGDPPADWRVTSVEGPVAAGGFVLDHHPGEADAAYRLCGHLHPGVRLRGPGGDAARLPCLWLRRHEAVLPAFGPFTGLKDIRPGRDDRVLVFTDGTVAEVC